MTRGSGIATLSFIGALVRLGKKKALGELEAWPLPKAWCLMGAQRGVCQEGLELRLSTSEVVEVSGLSADRIDDVDAGHAAREHSVRFQSASRTS